MYKRKSTTDTGINKKNEDSIALIRVCIANSDVVCNMKTKSTFIMVK